MNDSGFNVRRLRLIIFSAVTILHIALILLVVIRMETAVREAPPTAGVMRLFDVEEEAPPPPPPPEPPPPQTTTQENIAEHIIETDEPVPPYDPSYRPPEPSQQIEYLPVHRVTNPPILPETEIIRNMIYPPIAQRSNIEGTVFLEVFIDRYGTVRDVRVLRENPPNRGFGEAAINAFSGIRGKPADADGVPVAVRFRYNLSFRLN